MTKAKVVSMEIAQALDDEYMAPKSKRNNALVQGDNNKIEPKRGKKHLENQR